MALVPDAVGHTEAAVAAYERRSAHRADLRLGRAKRGGGAGNKVGDGDRVAEGVGRFQVDEPADRDERLVALDSGQGGRKPGFGVEDDVPRLGLVEVVKDLV